MANALCREGEALGLSSILICYDPLPENAERFAPAAPYEQLDRRQADFIPRLRTLLHDESVDVAHAQGHIPACYLARAMAGLERPPARLASMHVGLQGTWRWLWRIRQCLRAMDRITAVSRDMAQTYGRLAGRPVDIVANGVDCRDLMRIVPASPRSGEPFRFAMLSRLDRVKRHAEAVFAGDQLIASGFHIELHIAGEGACHAELAAMANTRPWLILAGAIHDPATFFVDKHAFLLPSQAEGMPLALAEAMTAGLPSIVSDLPSLREMAGEAALYVPVGGANALAIAMKRLMVEPELREHFANIARRRAAGFDIRTVAGEYVAIYRSLAKMRHTFSTVE